jgi:histidyl-tRNA synthetase
MSRMNYGQLAFPFRRYQIGKVYRGERAQRGRFREFYQADIDVIGDGELSILNDAEMPVHHLPHLFRSLGLPLPDPRQQPQGPERLLRHARLRREAAGDIMRTIDKLDKIGADKVNEMLA